MTNVLSTITVTKDMFEINAYKPRMLVSTFIRYFRCNHVQILQ